MGVSKVVGHNDAKKATVRKALQTYEHIKPKASQNLVNQTEWHLPLVYCAPYFKAGIQPPQIHEHVNGLLPPEKESHERVTFWLAFLVRYQ
jgi:lysophospholipase L1-like esterase